MHKVDFQNLAYTIIFTVRRKTLVHCLPHKFRSRSSLHSFVNLNFCNKQCANSYKPTYLLPINKHIIPKSTKSKSMAFDRRFFSFINIAPNAKDTITLPRRTIDTTAIMAPGHDKA